MEPPNIISSRYEIRGVVGRGGMGVVYKAYDRVIGRDVALKTLGDIVGRAALEMFYKEWRILANLHHPNIIEIFDIGEFDDAGVVKPYFVMPLLPGMTLEQLMHAPGQPLPLERLAEIVSHVCRGLQAIHDAGLVHRDIKPSNIFVMEFNSVKLIDFGIAHLSGGNTVTGLKGTVSYMAPEQIQNQECSPASDIFSLGVVCYEVLCGVRPFQSARSEDIFEAILRHIPPPIYEVNPAISQTVSRTIHKALAKQPRHRYASALEFGDTLQRASRGEPIPALDPTRIQPRIERAVRAFEQGNFQMATDILSDLEAAGHVEPTLKPLRNQIDQALKNRQLRDLLDRARLGLEEGEHALALQNAEAALKLDPANVEAGKLRETIQAEISRAAADDWLSSAERSMATYAFGAARQLLLQVLQLRPADPKATALIEQVEERERAYRAARQEKEDLYRAARDAWQNSEFASAGAKLERILELESRAPDTTSESATNYVNFLTLVRSAETVIENTRARCLEYVAAGEFEKAIDLARDCISKYPGHPVPQGLAQLAESEQKRALLLQKAEMVRLIGGEPDLEKKMEMFRRAIERFPAEPLFEQWMRPVRDRLALAKAVAAKAQRHEEHGRSEEAAEQRRMLRAISFEKTSLDHASVPSAAPAASALAMAAGAAAAVAEAPVPAAAAAAVPPTVAEAPPPPPPLPSPVQGPPQTFAAPQHRRGRSAPLVVGAGAAAMLLIAGGVIFTAAHRRRPGGMRPESPGRVSVVLRPGTPGAAVRLGNLAATSGEIHTELAPGEYPVEEDLPGYEPYTGTLEVGKSGAPQTLPPLRPSPCAVAFSTDLPGARAQLDDRTEAAVQEGRFGDAVEAGPHTIRVTDGTHQAQFDFVSAAAVAPVLKGPLPSNGMTAIAAHGLGPDWEVESNNPASVVTVDGAPPASREQGRFRFTGLQPGPHRLVVAIGKDERSMAIETGSRPAIWLALYSGRDVGGVLVTAGLPQFQVSLDGKPYARKIQGGSMWIPDLPVKSYRLRVTAEGYEPLEQTINVVRGSISATVQLTLTVQFATLAIKGALPRTQVLIDGVACGAADADGNLTCTRVAPGERRLELQNPPQFKPLQLSKTFVRRETLTLTGPEVRLERNPAEVELAAFPEIAAVEYRCGESAWQHARGHLKVACAEAQLTLKVSAEGFHPDERTLALTPGQNLPLRIELKRAAVAVVQPLPSKKSCDSGSLSRSGWVADKDWVVAGRNGAALPCNDLPGTYEFTIRLPKGPLAGKIQGKVQGVATAGEFTFEKRAFTLRGGSRRDLSAFDKDGAVTVRILVEPSQVQFLATAGDSWQPLAAMPGDFRKIQLVFPAGARINGFSFTEK